MRLRCRHKKIGLFRFLSGTQLSLIIDEGLRRTGVNFEYTRGFNPRIKVNFSLPIPVGIASVAEWFDVSLKERVDKEKFLENFNDNIQRELRITEVYEIPDNEKPVINKIRSYEYRIFSKTSVDEKIIKDFNPIKGRILGFRLQKGSITIIDIKATANQEEYFNINNFIRETGIQPIITIKTKTHMR